MLVRLLVVSCAILLGLPGTTQSRASLPVFAVGTNDYGPAACGHWSWVGACDAGPRAQVLAQQQMTQQARWFAQDHLGSFQRLWVMLDQGMQGQGSLSRAYLATLDATLAAFAAQGQRVDLVALEASAGTADRHQFRITALDGAHPLLRAAYLTALRALVTHLGQNPTDAATVAVLDLCNECYYQLGRFGVPEAAIHQWIADAYATVHAAQPGLTYTVSDAGGLLRNPAHWLPLYRDDVDVFDLHVYDDAPWANAALYASARTLPKPWFAGEAGCAPGHISCTYDGTVPCTEPQTCALSVDTWWLRHLHADGAHAVLIENTSTALGPPGPSGVPALTLVGRTIASGS